MPELPSFKKTMDGGNQLWQEVPAESLAMSFNGPEILVERPSTGSSRDSTSKLASIDSLNPNNRTSVTDNVQLRKAVRPRTAGNRLSNSHELEKIRSISTFLDSIGLPTFQEAVAKFTQNNFEKCLKLTDNDLQVSIKDI
jgi:hypothetical protein